MDESLRITFEEIEELYKQLDIKPSTNDQRLECQLRLTMYPLSLAIQVLHLTLWLMKPLLYPTDSQLFLQQMCCRE